ncbi:MAG: T9SS type A sorting domain-containing protein [Bacteroidales bacterium]
MKKLFAVLLFVVHGYFIQGQHYVLQESFDKGNALTAEWELKLDSPYTSASNCGSSIPALKFSATGHYLITPLFSSATDLSFWMKGVSTDTLSTFIIEGLRGNEWAELQRICPIPRTGRKMQFELAGDVTRLRFSYIKSAGNVAFDDLAISYPSHPPQILSCSISQIKDYSAAVEISTDTSGIIAYLVLPNSAPEPLMGHMLHFNQYPDVQAIADSGHITANAKTLTLELTNLSPSTPYRIYLLTTGSKNNVDSSSQLLSKSFTTLKPQPTLFFSAIVKGKGNNKVIAIYNPTSDTIKLIDYRIALSTNGGGWLTSYFTFSPTALLQPHSQYLIMKSTADSTFKATYPADTLTGSRIINFTGNDARALQRTVNKGSSWFTIDLYGLPNQATNFAVAGITDAAANHNLFRKRYITTGNANWQKSAGNDSLSSEWMLKPLSDFSLLLEPFKKTHRRLTFKNLSFATIPMQMLVDTLQQQIYVTFADTVDLKHIPWQVTLDSNLVILPHPTHLQDFSTNFSFSLVDTLWLDTCVWSFRIKTAPTLVSIIRLEETVSIYPNPTQELLHISGIQNDSIKRIEIISTSGEIVWYGTHSPIRINMLPSGNYCIKLYLFDHKVISKFFVKTP